MEVGESASTHRQKPPRRSLTGALQYSPYLPHGRQRPREVRRRCLSAPCLSRRWCHAPAKVLLEAGDAKRPLLFRRLGSFDPESRSCPRASCLFSPLEKGTCRRLRRRFQRERRTSSGGCFSHRVLSFASRLDSVFSNADFRTPAPGAEPTECLHGAPGVSPSFASCFPPSFSACSSPPSPSGTESSGRAAQSCSSPQSSLSTSPLPLSPLTSFSNCSSVTLSGDQSDTLLPVTVLSSTSFERPVDTPPANVDRALLTSCLGSFLPRHASNGRVEEENGYQHCLPIRGVLYCVFDPVKGPSIRAAHPPSLWRALERPGGDCFSGKTMSDGVSAGSTSTHKDAIAVEPDTSTRGSSSTTAAGGPGLLFAGLSDPGLDCPGRALAAVERTGRRAEGTAFQHCHQDLSRAWSRPCSGQDQKKTLLSAAESVPISVPPSCTLSLRQCASPNEKLPMSTASEAPQLPGVMDQETGGLERGKDDHSHPSSRASFRGGLEGCRDPSSKCGRDSALVRTGGATQGVDRIQQRSSEAERRAEVETLASRLAAADGWRDARTGKGVHEEDALSCPSHRHRAPGCCSHQSGLCTQLSQGGQLGLPQCTREFQEDTEAHTFGDCQQAERDEEWHVPPFRCLYRYLLPPAHLTEKLVRLKMGSTHLVGHPQLIVNETYERNAFQFCFAFLYDEATMRLKETEQCGKDASEDETDREAMMLRKPRVHSMLAQVAERVNCAFRSVEEKYSWLSTASVFALVATVRNIFRHFVPAREVTSKPCLSRGRNAQCKDTRGLVRPLAGEDRRKDDESCRVVHGLSPTRAFVEHPNSEHGLPSERSRSGRSCLRLLLPGLEDRGALAVHVPPPSSFLVQQARRKKMRSCRLYQATVLDFKRLNPACLPPQKSRAFWARVPVPLIDLKQLMQNARKEAMLSYSELDETEGLVMVISLTMLPVLPASDCHGSFVEHDPEPEPSSPSCSSSVSAATSSYCCSSPAHFSCGTCNTPCSLPSTSSACSKRHPGRQDECLSPANLMGESPSASDFVFSVASSPHIHRSAPESDARSYCSPSSSCMTVTSPERTEREMSRSSRGPPVFYRDSPSVCGVAEASSHFALSSLRPDLGKGRQRRRSSLLSSCKRSSFLSEERATRGGLSAGDPEGARRGEAMHGFEEEDKLRERGVQSKHMSSEMKGLWATSGSPYCSADTSQCKGGHNICDARASQTGRMGGAAETCRGPVALRRDEDVCGRPGDKGWPGQDEDAILWSGHSAYLSPSVKWRGDPDPASCLMDGTLYHLFPLIDGTRSVYEIAAAAFLPKRLVKTIMAFLAEERLVAFVDKFDITNRYRLTPRFGPVWRLPQFRRLAPYYVMGKCPPQNGTTSHGADEAFLSRSDSACCAHGSYPVERFPFGKAQDQEGVFFLGRRDGPGYSKSPDSVFAYQDLHCPSLSQNSGEGLSLGDKRKMATQTGSPPPCSSEERAQTYAALGVSRQLGKPASHGSMPSCPIYAVRKCPNSQEGPQASPSQVIEHSGQCDLRRGQKSPTEGHLAGGPAFCGDCISSVRDDRKPRPVPLPVLIFLYSRLTEFGCSPQPAGCPLMVFLRRYGSVLDVLRISIAHFIMLGCIFGFLRRVHEHPVFVLLKDSRKKAPTSPSCTGQSGGGAVFEVSNNGISTNTRSCDGADGKTEKRSWSRAEKDMPTRRAFRSDRPRNSNRVHYAPVNESEPPQENSVEYSAETQQRREAGICDEISAHSRQLRGRADAGAERIGSTQGKRKTQFDRPSIDSSGGVTGMSGTEWTAASSGRPRSAGICGNKCEAAGGTVRLPAKAGAGQKSPSTDLLALEEVSDTAIRISRGSERDSYSRRRARRSAGEGGLGPSSRPHGRLSAETVAKIAAMCNGGSSLDEILVRFHCETKGDAIALVVRAAKASRCKVVWLYR